MSKHHDFILLDSGTLEQLKISARASRIGRDRICLHQSHNDQIQEMIVVVCKGTYIRPHQHNHKSESLHVIEGQIAIVFFDDKGIPVSFQLLGGKQQPFICRLANSAWHTVIPLTETAVIHEAIGGPFEKDASRYAAWSPADDADPEDIKDFLTRLIQFIS